MSDKHEEEAAVEQTALDQEPDIQTPDQGDETPESSMTEPQGELKEKPGATKAKRTKTDKKKSGAPRAKKPMAEKAHKKQKKAFWAIDPHSQERGMGWYYRMVLVSMVILLVTVGVALLAGFFITLQGEETVLVPRVQGDELLDALVELERFQLVPSVQSRYDSNPLSKGTILEQSPPAGTPVKIGRKINITVSKGTVVDRIGNYLGRDIAEVRQELLTLSASSAGQIRFDPANIVYQYDDSPENTVLAQDPEPGSSLADGSAISLSFVVSRGPEDIRFTLPQYDGLEYSDVIALLARQNVPFSFEFSSEATGIPGSIVSQTPPSGEAMYPGDSVVLTMIPFSNQGSSTLFELVEIGLPRYSVPVEMDVFIRDSDGSVIELFSMVHPGGRFKLPVSLGEGQILVVNVQGEQAFTYIAVADAS